MSEHRVTLDGHPHLVVTSHNPPAGTISYKARNNSHQDIDSVTDLVAFESPSGDRIWSQTFTINNLSQGQHYDIEAHFKLGEDALSDDSSVTVVYTGKFSVTLDSNSPDHVVNWHSEEMEFKIS